MALAACWVCFWANSAFDLPSSELIALVLRSSLDNQKSFCVFMQDHQQLLLETPLTVTFLLPIIRAGL